MAFTVTFRAWPRRTAVDRWLLHRHGLNQQAQALDLRRRLTSTRQEFPGRISVRCNMPVSLDPTCRLRVAPRMRIAPMLSRREAQEIPIGLRSTRRAT